MLIQGSCQLIDVREPAEYHLQRITAAKLIPLGELEKRHAEVDQSKPVVVMCQAGMRGSKAAQLLSKLGYPQVLNLEGGMSAWQNAGLKFEKSGNGLPVMQQTQLVIGLGVVVGAILAIALHPLYALICAFFGCGLTLAGSTGWCGLALLLAKMPWNQKHSSQCCS